MPRKEGYGSTHFLLRLVDGLILLAVFKVLFPAPLVAELGTTESDAAEPATPREEDLRKERVDLLKKDHENALEEASSQARQQYALNQLFVTVLFAAFGLAFEKRIEAVFAILPLFGCMCIISLFWKDLIWYLAIKRVAEVETELEKLTGAPTLTWGRVHGESYADYGYFDTLKARFGLGRLRQMLNLCYFVVTLQYVLIIGASIVLWANAPLVAGLTSQPVSGANVSVAVPVSVGPAIRYSITTIHISILLCGLYLWGQRRRWLEELDA